MYKSTSKILLKTLSFLIFKKPNEKIFLKSSKKDVSN